MNNPEEPFELHGNPTAVPVRLASRPDVVAVAERILEGYTSDPVALLRAQVWIGELILKTEREAKGELIQGGILDILRAHPGAHSLRLVVANGAIEPERQVYQLTLMARPAPLPTANHGTVRYDGYGSSLRAASIDLSSEIPDYMRGKP